MLSNGISKRKRPRGPGSKLRRHERRAAQRADLARSSGSEHAPTDGAAAPRGATNPSREGPLSFDSVMSESDVLPVNHNLAQVDGAAAPRGAAHPSDGADVRGGNVRCGTNGFALDPAAMNAAAHAVTTAAAAATAAEVTVAAHAAAAAAAVAAAATVATAAGMAAAAEAADREAAERAAAERAAAAERCSPLGLGAAPSDGAANSGGATALRGAVNPSHGGALPFNSAMSNILPVVHNLAQEDGAAAPRGAAPSDNAAASDGAATPRGAAYGECPFEMPF